ncbi:leucine-rich repeat domain-containing protein [Sunxiuqinia elliptica]
MKQILLFFALLMAVVTTNAQGPTSYTLTADDITVNEGGVILSCNINDFNTETYAFGNIIIPQTINKEGVDIAITSINDCVFMLLRLASVVVPEGVKNIGYQAFYSCHLTSITLPNGLQSIGGYAFAFNNLTSITFPNGLLNIRSYAFSSNQLTSVTLPETLIIIEECAFANNNNLTLINLPKHESTPGFEGWIDYNKQKVIKTEEGNYTVSNFYVPYYAIIPYTLTADDVTIDNEGCIISCNILKGTKLTIPQTLNKEGPEITITGIGSSVFASRGLQDITLPNSITSIGEEAFATNSLTNLVLPQTLKSIGNAAFSYNRLQGVDFPETVTSIGESSFSSNNIMSVTLSEKLVNIGFKAFAYNGNLASITLPKHDATPGFTGWKDGSGAMVPLTDGNYTVSVFATSYTAFISEPLAPAAPTLAGKTHNSIILTVVEGCEYSIDNGTTWQDAVLFEGLNENTAYTFVQRYAKTEISLTSPASAPLTVTTDKPSQSAPSAPTLASKTHNSITLNSVQGCEYSINNGTTWQDAVLFDGLVGNTSYILIQRYAETETFSASPQSAPLTVITDKASPSAPVVPVLASKTQNSITLKAVEGCEYSIDNGLSWQREVLFEGLEMNTTYIFVQRYFETNTGFASPSSAPFMVTTNKTPQTAPDAPILVSRTYNSIILAVVEGCEYSIDNGATWQDATLFEGLQANFSYTFVQRYAETEMYSASAISASVTATTKKISQSAPAAPTLAGKTESSITLNAKAGCEYSIDGGGSWQNTVLFDGLESGTSYTLLQRYARTSIHYVSPASVPLIVVTEKAQQLAPAAPTLASKTENSITLNAAAGCEYSIDGGVSWQSDVLFDGLEISTAYVLVQRYFEIDTHYASELSEALTVVTDKAQKAAPVAPTLASKTDSSIVLTVQEGCEYSIDNGETWQDTVLFDGLDGNTLYRLIQRYAETDMSHASLASESLTVTTDISTAIDELENGGIKLYPNPANNVVTVSNAPVGACLIVYDISGGMVLQTMITDRQQLIDVSRLKSGVYLVKIGAVPQRLIVQK